MSTSTKKKAASESNLNAEQKILEAARKLFAAHGYDGTKTRDIATEAGINLALLNYYFRSKEKLFEMVMLEAMQHFIHGLEPVINNRNLSLKEKLTAFVKHYTHLFLSNPDMPLFVMSEIRKNPVRFEANLGVRKVLMESDFIRQLREACPEKVNPFHLLINTISLTVFPFIAAPMLKTVGKLDDKVYARLLDERINLIPEWMGLQLKETKVKSSRK